MTPESSYHHGNLREALLDAVGEIIAERGPAAVSLREAARRAGVSHGAPAHHFGDKLGLLTAFSTRGLELFRDRMQRATAELTDPHDKINAIGLEYLRFAMEERAYFEVMFRAELHDAEQPDHKQAAFDAFSVVTGIADEIAQLVDDIDPMVLALKAWSMVHGLASLWLDGAIGQFWDGDDIYDLALGIFSTELQAMDRAAAERAAVEQAAAELRAGGSP